MSSGPDPNQPPAGNWPPGAGYPAGYGEPAAGPGPYPPPLPPGYPPSPPGYPPPRRAKSKTLWWGVIAGALVIVIGATAAALYFTSDRVKIRKLVNAFSAEVYGGHPRQMADYMCSEDAQSFLDIIDDPDADIAPEKPPQFRISDLRIKGDVASAKLTFEPTGLQTMYFRKDAGTWRVCAAAEDQM